MTVPPLRFFATMAAGTSLIAFSVPFAMGCSYRLTEYLMAPRPPKRPVLPPYVDEH